MEAPVQASRFASTQEIRINVWGAISVNGSIAFKRVSNHFDSIQYLEVISEVLPELFEANDSLIYMQDNASIHATAEIRNFFERHNISKIMWPARSPDLNPIENLWGHITRKLDLIVDKEGEARTADELWRRFQLCAAEIPLSEFKNLYESVSKRIKSVIQKNGFYTKY